MKTKKFCRSAAFLDLPLDKDSEPLVEPEVLEALVGHQVPGPGVSYLVGYHISIGLHNAYKIYITIITLMLGMV